LRFKHPLPFVHCALTTWPEPMHAFFTQHMHASTSALVQCGDMSGSSCQI